MCHLKQLAQRYVSLLQPNRKLKQLLMPPRTNRFNVLVHTPPLLRLETARLKFNSQTFFAGKTKTV